MKKAEWQAVYAPRGDALERRVRQTLDRLEEKNRYAYPKRGAFIAAALVLALITAAAVAAGLTRSARYDAKRLAYQALEENTALRRIWRAFSPARRREGRADRRHLSRQQRCGRFCVEAGRLHRYDSERSG